MPRIVHFEVPAENPERVMTFYGEVFGWTFQKWDGPTDYWMVMTGDKEQPGIDGGIMARHEGEVGHINSIDVPSVDAYVAKITAHGGQLIVPKMTIPGVGYMAYCHDTEGNLFGVFQYDTSATQE